MFFKLLLTVLIATYIYASSASPVHISQNTITTNEKYIDGSVKEGITVGAGVYWSIFVDQSFESNVLSVQDSAKFYITNTNDVGTVNFGSLVNSNIVAVLYPSGLSTAPLTISGAQIQNDGDLFFSNASQVNLIADQWENTGIISITGPEISDYLPGVNISNSGSSQLVNSGDICLTNQFYRMDQQLYGGGCIHLFESSSVLIGQIDPNNPLDNTIVLNGPEVYLGFTPSGASYTVAGYGGGNAITLYDIQMAYEYDDQSGILTIASLTYLDHFNIGPGYNKAYFKLEEGACLVYTGPVPNLPPSQGRVCPPLPIPPSPGNI